MLLFRLFLPATLLFRLGFLCITLFLRSRIAFPIYMLNGYEIEADNEEKDVCFSIAEDVSEGVRCPVSFEERGLVSWNERVEKACQDRRTWWKRRGRFVGERRQGDAYLNA